MKLHFAQTLSLAVMATLVVGCGNNKKSSSSVGIATNQGACSQSTFSSYSDIKLRSKKPINRQTQIHSVDQSCQQVERELAGQSCTTGSHGNRIQEFISYSDIAGFCAEIQTYVNQRNPVPTPRPIPSPNLPLPGQNRYGKVLVENLDGRYALYFHKTYLEQADLDLRSSQTRCKISIPERSNNKLEIVRGKLISMTMRTNTRGTTYDVVTVLSSTGDLVRLTCRSHSSQLTLQSLNQVLDGVAEIKQKR